MERALNSASWCSLGGKSIAAPDFSPVIIVAMSRALCTEKRIEIDNEKR
jgi:hypothetical protein